MTEPLAALALSFIVITLGYLVFRMLQEVYYERV